MKKIFLFPSILIVVALACDLSVTVVPPTSPAPLPTNTMVPVTVTPVQPLDPTTTPEVFIALTQAIPGQVQPTDTVLPPALEGVEVSVDPLRIVLSPVLASGARGNQFPRAEGENIAPWEVTPGHTQLKLEGYVLQGKFHQPQILVYPAMDYVEMYPPAFESIHRLDNILYGPGAPVSDWQLPAVPFFNAQQVFASNIQAVSFQNGGGVRFLTEYAQYPASVNNHDLFYHFQGLTRDGTYYIVAIFPITAPVLAETSDGGAILPPGGVAYPDITDPNADWQGYYTAITTLLNATSPDAFFPTINQLDSLIESMRISQ